MRFDFHHHRFTDTSHSAGKLALAGSDRDLRWQDLEAETVHLSRLFTSLAIPEGEPVIIYGHKEAFFAVAMLACYHSGTTYTPIDKIYPVERVRKIIDLTGAQVIVNCTGLPLPDGISCAVEIDPHAKAVQHGPRQERTTRPGFEGDILQYIMFTSGSTGEPKGVQILRSSVLCFVDWATRDFGFTPDDVFLNQAPFTFDVSLCDLLNAFALGGTLVLSAAEITKDQDQFLQRVTDYRCTVWTSTPSFAYIYLRHPAFNGQKMPSLHTFLFMGEELPSRTCSLLHRQFPGARVMNAYGPTEATIVTTLVEISPEMAAQQASVPIGYPMPASTLLIDTGGEDREDGELIIAGPHVSPGYYNRPDLNEKKFFVREDGQRAFRTGDLAYYKNGMIYFLGRNDDQIKLHGFRIELDEISQVLCDHSGIEDAVTVPLKRNKEVKKIISFVKSASHTRGCDIREALLPVISRRLPYYMIPAEIIVVEEFPYNVSHKIDRNKLVEQYLAGEFGKNVSS
ncbi:MAG: amino acid adenylation domain-containing protein [Bacteroidia bacterium]|nr:amino acid adenylation domain-containing protein [Bacteroidia bacterium]